ncbi:hypothetical protein, partial [Bradyrhizobium sp.]|uniref:hypothetical protein n=1 Tax=Bradyrhizobium sp. TaxID=376 RepID=UPI0025C3A801
MTIKERKFPVPPTVYLRGGMQSPQPAATVVRLTCAAMAQDHRHYRGLNPDVIFAGPQVHSAAGDVINETSFGLRNCAD